MNARTLEYFTVHTVYKAKFSGHFCTQKSNAFLSPVAPAGTVHALEVDDWNVRMQQEELERNGGDQMKT